MDYKYDVLEKLGECYCLIYLIFGIFACYGWACKQLDFISDIERLNGFYDPIALGLGFFNIINISFMISANIKYKKNRALFIKVNNESNILFYILCIPLFIVSIIYLILQVIWEIVAVTRSANYGITGLTILETITEILLFSFTVIFIVNQNNNVLSIRSNMNLFNFNKFVTILSGIGVTLYFLFHMTSQQIHNFIDVSSNYKYYEKYYGKNVTGNRTFEYLSHNKVRTFMQPLVILFCCSCISYLITIFCRNLWLDDENVSNDELRSHIDSTEQIVSDENIDNYGAVNENFNNDEDIDRNNENNIFPIGSNDDNNVNDVNNNVNENKDVKTPSFRLPPMSLVVGILFITLTILLLIITDSFTSQTNNKKLRLTGVRIFDGFTIPVYIISFGLLIMQIIEIKKWNKIDALKQKDKKGDKEDYDEFANSIVDKILVWVGASGQLIVAFGMIKSITATNNDNSSLDDEEFNSIYCLIMFEYILLILNTILQCITISLALDREWKEPTVWEWQDYICPSVGMLSINFGFFIFSAYAVKMTEKKVLMDVDKDPLFLKIFDNGFHTLGETLAILHRLHSALIFGRMVVSTNH